MTTPYKHVPVPTHPVERSEEETNGVVLVKGRERKQRAIARRDQPILHHGANPKQHELLSGELRCTLTALSPLLVANQQVEVACLDDESGNALANELTASLDEIKRELRELVQELEARQRESEAELAQRKNNEDAAIIALCAEFRKKKSVLFPRQLSREGAAPVVISGEGLKGMLQLVIGSLTGAPLDRVDEASYASRPNANFPPTNVPLRTIPIAGRVRKSMNKESDALEVEPIVDIGRIEWVHGKPLIQRNPRRVFCCGDKIDQGTDFDGKFRVASGHGANRRFRWKDRGNGSSRIGSPARLLRVRFGFDAGSALYRAHNNRGPLFKHEQAIVPEELFVQGILRVDEVVKHQLLKSGNYAISSDPDTGRLTEDHPLSGKFHGMPQRHELPQEHDLMFFELLLPRPQPFVPACQDLLAGTIKLADCLIIEGGQNYYYPWVHAESVKQAIWGWDGKRWKTEVRAEFDPWGSAARGSVDALRNLFGYVRTDEKADGKKELDGNTRPALAGRISINYALERVAPSTPPAKRFLTGFGGSGFAVWLQPLSGPKGPSWAKGYVPGNEGVNAGQPMRTLGDGIRQVSNGIEIQNLVTTAFGPKHYLHHKETLGNGGETDRGRAHFDLPAFIAEREKIQDAADSAQKKIERRKPLITDQSAIALRVSRPGTTFGFTVRFRDLRAAELGLLALALNPDLIADAFGGVDGGLQKTRETYRAATAIDDENVPIGRRFGLRLGHGKPLGMGSVAVSIDQALLWKDAATERIDPGEFVEATLKDQGLVPDETLAATLEVLRLDHDAQSYLSQELCVKPQSVLDHAKKIRKDHSDASRKQGFGNTAI